MTPSGTMQQDRLMVNPYHIHVRTTTINDPALRNEVSRFGADLVTLLDGYEKKRLEIEKNSALSAEGRVQELAKLKAGYSAPLENFLIRAEGTFDLLRARFRSMITAALQYKADTSATIELMRQGEAREKLAGMGLPELVGLLMAESTPDLVFYSLLNAPLPLVSDRELDLGSMNKVRRADPAILSFHGDAIEVATVITASLMAAYGYLNLRTPRNVSLDLPGYLGILRELSYPGDSLKS